MVSDEAAALFDLDPLSVPSPAAIAPARAGEQLSADRRRTLRQRADVAVGRHPLTRGPLAVGPSLTCGRCRFREVLAYHARSYPKCVWQPASAEASSWPPRVSHGSASDVRAWWPACPDYEAKR